MRAGDRDQGRDAELKKQRQNAINAMWNAAESAMTVLLGKNTK